MNTIQETIKSYFDAWNEAFISKNGDHIRFFMSKTFTGYWAHSTIEKPDVYDYNYDLNSVLQQYNNAYKSFKPESISKRNNGEQCIVMGTETNIINDKPHPAKCMFIWQCENNQWKLVREYIELEK